MGFRLPTVAMFVLSLVSPAMAGQGRTDGAAAAATSTVDPARLPINISRIGRQIRQTEVREQREGLRLHYSIQVYGETPQLKLITPLDNLLTGDVPRSAPTHNDMIRQMTPLEFSAPVIGIGSVPSRK
jgi:hypothetical protein